MRIWLWFMLCVHADSWDHSWRCASVPDGANWRHCSTSCGSRHNRYTRVFSIFYFLFFIFLNSSSRIFYHCLDYSDASIPTLSLIVGANLLGGWLYNFSMHSLIQLV